MLKEYITSMSASDWAILIGGTITVLVSAGILYIESKNKTPNKKTFAIVTLVFGIVIIIGNCKSSVESNNKTDDLIDANKKIDKLTTENIELSKSNSSKIDESICQLESIIGSSSILLNNIKIESQNLEEIYQLTKTEQRRTQFPVTDELLVYFKIHINTEEEYKKIFSSFNKTNSISDSTLTDINKYVRSAQDSISSLINSIGNGGQIATVFSVIGSNDDWDLVIGNTNVSGLVREWRQFNYKSRPNHDIFNNFPNYHIENDTQYKNFTLIGQGISLDVRKKESFRSLYDFEGRKFRAAIWVASSGPNVHFFEIDKIELTIIGPNKTNFKVDTFKKIKTNNECQLFETVLGKNIWQ